MISAKNLALDQLRQKVLEYSQKAQAEYTKAREDGTPINKDLIVTYIKQQRTFELEIAALEDQSSGSRPEEDDENVSETQLNVRVDQALISAVEKNLYVAGYDAIQDDQCLIDVGITHILSTCSFYLPSTEQQQIYACHNVSVLDTPDQNLLQYFDQCNDFVAAAVASGGKVLVHCHAGQSRSPAFLAAYLMQRDKSSVRAALEKIKMVRRVQPNDGFMEQLRLYRDCDFHVSDTDPLYRHWKFKSQVSSRLSAFATESDSTAQTSASEVTRYSENDAPSTKYTQIRCKKCRFVLASEKHVIQHAPKELVPSHSGQPDSQQQQQLQQPQAATDSLILPQCAHFFLEPIRWMKTELDKGTLDGRFVCPGRACGAKIGSYKWQGMTCSCRTWILPALCLQRSKVDELKSKTAAKIEPARRT